MLYVTKASLPSLPDFSSSLARFFSVISRHTNVYWLAHGLDFGTVNILDFQCNAPLFGQYQNQPCEYLVYLILNLVAEAVNGVEIRLFIPGKPHEIDVAFECCLNLAFGIVILKM